jgi:glyoxylase-like metal-dependent hydrolase (beta-lactamase superfamily II)
LGGRPAGRTARLGLEDGIMPCYICVTCGAQYPESVEPPAHCRICEDERQWVNWDGQAWTTLEALRRNHRTVVREEEPWLTGIGVEPSFAIGQRALLVQTPAGNLLWDCLGLIDDAGIRALEALGGVAAIAVSHPHFYTCMVEWSRAFGQIPVYVHAADRAWVTRPDDAIVYWDTAVRPVLGDLTLIRCAGHFAGAAVLHWPAGAGGRGVLLTGDTLQVTPDRRYVSFMYSYPNYIPLDASAVRRIAAAVAPFEFDRMYGGWVGRRVAADAKAVVARSVARYVRAIGGGGGGPQS